MVDVGVALCAVRDAVFVRELVALGVRVRVLVFVGRLVRVELRVDVLDFVIVDVGDGECEAVRDGEWCVGDDDSVEGSVIALEKDAVAVAVIELVRTA